MLVVRRSDDDVLCDEPPASATTPRLGGQSRRAVGEREYLTPILDRVHPGGGPFQALTSILPVLSPCSMPMKALAMFSNPSTTSSRYFSLPARSQSGICRRTAPNRF